MCEEGILKNDFKFILECVVNWKFESKVIDIIEKYITKSGVSKSKKTGTKKQRIEKTNTITPENSIIALSFINVLLESETSRNVILKNEKISRIMAELMNEVCDYLEKDSYDDGEFSFEFIS
jgi:hypothetical protein